MRLCVKEFGMMDKQPERQYIFRTFYEWCMENGKNRWISLTFCNKLDSNPVKDRRALQKD